MSESGRHGQLTRGLIVRRLEFDRRHIADRFEKSPLIEPVNRFERGEFDGFDPLHGLPAVLTLAALWGLWQVLFRLFLS